MENRLDYKFSIITVCYNEEKTIQKTIESVLKQTWKDFEYVIVDGASYDGTENIVSNYVNHDCRIKWYSEKDCGIYNAMNKGISHAKGEFIYFLNAGDVLYSEDVLEKVAEVIDLRKAEIIIGDIVIGNALKSVRYSYNTGKKLYENLRKRIGVCHQAIFASKSSLDDGFDEEFIICADFNWLCQQVNKHRKIEKVDCIVVNYDNNGFSSQVHNQKLMIKESIKIVKNNFGGDNLKKHINLEALLIEKEKNRYLYELMNRWIILKQQRVNISSFFINRGIERIAIYGMHYIGERLYDELIDAQVEIVYAIDRNKYKENWKIPILQPNEQLDTVDAIVITPIFDFIEIKESLSQKITCLMISIEEILFYEY